jgi:hypothetical protein
MADAQHSLNRWAPLALALAAVCIGLAYFHTPVAMPAPEYVALPDPVVAQSPNAPLPVAAPTARRAPPVARQETTRFSCDGRNRCTQMTSCAEATFFLRNCPGQQTDGDHDGVPCERQWCH